MDKPRILVVDDEEAILYAYKRMLSPHMEFEVDAAKSLEEAKAFLKKHKYKVLLTDLRLGVDENLRGFQLTRLMKRLDKDITVILVTAYGNLQVKKKAYKLGVDFYFEKPVSIYTLKELLASVLKLKKNQ